MSRSISVDSPLKLPQLPALSLSLESVVTSSLCYSTSSGYYRSLSPELQWDSGLFIKRRKDGLVKSGTLPGLIQELIDANADSDYKQTFLTLYSTFSTGEEVLRLVIERFLAIPPSDTTVPSTDVRLHIFSVLEFWQKSDYIDVTDVELLRQMKEFAIFVQNSSTFNALSYRARMLVETIDKNLASLVSAPSHSTTKWNLRDSPPPLDFNARDIADVLTSIEGDRFRKLREMDYVNWLEGKLESNPVFSFIIENRKLSCWAERSILKPHDQSQRIVNLNYFLCIIKECIRLRNFSSACAISAGVTTKAITDLKSTFGRRNRSLFREAKALISVDNNLKVYRTAIKESKNACVPWLYVHLHDLKIFHRGCPGLVDEDGRKKLINFERSRQIHHRVREIQRYKPPVIEPANSGHHAKLCTLVDYELNAITTEPGIFNIAQNRSEYLAAEEGLGSVKPYKKLQAVSLSSASKRRHSTQAQYQMLSPLISSRPQSETSVSFTRPAPSSRESIDSLPPGLDVFTRDSKRCLDGRIIRPGTMPIIGGGRADIWEGILDDQKVAIKCIRAFSGNGGRVTEEKLLRRMMREYVAWTTISHPAVLKCLGFTYDLSPQSSSLPSLISPWMSNGTLPKYIASHPKTDRLRILLDVADGLSYLHAQIPAIIHGDIRGDNILISNNGRPCLDVFWNLSTITTFEDTIIPSEAGVSVRWMSPELFHDNATPSAESDVWAYAMTILEIMSERFPYADIKHELAVIMMIRQGQLPLRSPDIALPKKVFDEVWAICQKCWNILPKGRPSMREVLSELTALFDGKV